MEHPAESPRFLRCGLGLIAVVLLASAASAQGPEEPDPFRPLEKVPAHLVLLVSGEAVLGLAENLEDTCEDLVVKTFSGRKSYPRGRVIEVSPAEAEALAVFTPAELYEIHRKKHPPRSPEGHAALGDLCLRFEAFSRAVEHYEKALEGLEDPDRASRVRKRMETAGILARAAEAVVRRREVKRLLWGREFDGALENLEALRESYGAHPGLLELLSLDELEKSIRTERHQYLQRLVQRNFHRLLSRLVTDKVRGGNLSLEKVYEWATSPDGLAKELFAAISEKLEITPKEARELWNSREGPELHRHSYGTGTFLHAEVRARLVVLPQPPPSGAAWWKEARTHARKNHVIARFVEFGPGWTQVLRIENLSCRDCGGKGVVVKHSTESRESTRLRCTTCGSAGHERIVIWR